jgi:hypothetical protein
MNNISTAREQQSVHIGGNTAQHCGGLALGGGGGRLELRHHIIRQQRHGGRRMLKRL